MADTKSVQSQLVSEIRKLKLEGTLTTVLVRDVRGWPNAKAKIVLSKLKKKRTVKREAPKKKKPPKQK